MERIGRYEILRLLGRGGAGAVYEAALLGPAGLRRPVALKVLHEGGNALRREARIGGLLRHPNLVDVYEVGEEGGTWFCAMELCTGGTLANRGPLPARAVIEVGLQVCAALRYAHEELRLVHRDIKPQNLLLAHDGTVKVGDLGIARAAGFSDDRVSGTPGYMPPEQARGASVDGRADIFALGVTLAELAAGARPAADETVDLDAPDARTESPAWTVPAWLEPVFERCVAVAPADRWPDMDALAAALGDLEPTGPPGPGLREALGLHAPAPPALPPGGGNLYEERDAFVGRADELSMLDEALAEPCLLTLKGPAGIGKSRLAARAAARWRASGEGDGEAWFCALDQVRTAEATLVAIARTLDVRLPAEGAAEHLGRALARRGPLVLVLDNMEQIDGAGPVVQGLRDHAPEARLVVTSREALRVSGERVVEVGPLSTEAARDLVVARARQRGAEVDGDPLLAQLAHRLDGLPLALELAAGRLGVLSVQDVLERLDLSLLRRGTTDRHGTLQAALDWGWELLDDTERDALAQLSTFCGRFTLEAAEEVLDLGPTSVLDAVQALSDRSWLHRADAARFGMLASVRQYARARLSDGGAGAIRHGRWFARLGERVASDGGAASRADDADLDDLLEACRRAVSRGDGAVAVPTLRGAWTVTAVRGPYSSAVELAAAVRAIPGLSRHEQANVDRVAGSALRFLGRLEEAYVRFDAELAAWRALGDPAREGVVLGNLGTLLIDLGRFDEAREHLQAALGAHRAAGRRRSEVHTLGSLGALHMDLGRLDEALGFYETALASYRELGDHDGEALVLANLGNLCVEAGRHDEARSRYEGALVLMRARGSRRHEGLVLLNLVDLHMGAGRYDEARDVNAAALEVLREVQDRRMEAVALAHHGTIDRRTGHATAARTHLEAALAIAREAADRRLQGHILSELARLAPLDDAPALIEQAEGMLRQAGDPSLIAELLAYRAEVLWRTGDAEGARAALREAEVVVPPRFAQSRAEIDRVQALLDGQTVS